MVYSFYVENVEINYFKLFFIMFCEKAEELARIAHEGQYRRDGKTAYVVHLQRIVDFLNSQKWSLNSSINLDVLLSIAWLHDILEDTPVTIEELKKRCFPNLITTPVFVLTKNNEFNSKLSYHRYIENVSRYEYAKIVKFADILDNLTDNPTNQAKQRYKDALTMLSGILY